MAIIDITFRDCNDRESKGLQVFCSQNDKIVVRIAEHENYVTSIQLDKSTAIRLHKELKKQISLIEE